MKTSELVAFAVLALCGIESTLAASNYCSTPYPVKRLKYITTSYRCGWWFWTRSCYRRKCTYYTETLTNQYTCCKGWKGSRCDIPICNPQCQNGGFCISKDTCSCPAGLSGGTCQVQLCSYATDCYPGTCDRTSGTPRCICTAGFDGQRCEKMLQGPEYKRCSAQLIDLQGEVLTGTCGPPGTPDVYTYNTKHRDVKQIIIDAETTYAFSPDVPRKPSYVQESIVGNIKSYAEAKLYREDGTFVSEQTLICDERATKDTPHTSAECRNKQYDYTHAIGHNYSMHIVMYATSGGSKIIRNPDTNKADTHYYDGTRDNQTVIVNFDILDPSHCHTTPGSDTDCDADTPPLFTEEFTKNTSMTMDFYFGWSDDGTGLASFTVDIYKMGISSNNMLEHMGKPIFTETRNLLTEEENADTTSVYHNLPSPGRYSVVLTTADRAGNTKKARSLVLFDDQDRVERVPGQQIRLVNSVKGPYGHWLTSHNDNATTPMVITWKGVFANKYHVENNFMLESENLNLEDDGSEKEWGYEDVFGNLTRSAIINIDGITKFELGHDIDQVGGKHIKDNPPDLEEITPVKQNATISGIVKDGYTIGFRMKASDAVGYSLEETDVVHVDKSPPIVTSATFEKDMPSTIPDEILYASRLLVKAHDFHSGIGEVEFNVSVAANGKILGGRTASYFRLDNITSCIPGSNCTCIQTGDCFPTDIPVDVDNCWFRNNLLDRLKIKYVVRNGALISVSAREISVEPLQTVTGLDEYPNPRYFEAKNVSHNTLVITWKYPASCHDTRGVLIRYDGKDIHVDYPSTKHIVEEREAETRYTFIIIVRYDGGESLGKELSVQTPKPICIGIECPSPGLNPGEIFGIVIGSVILLIVIAILLVLLRRKRANKPAIPPAIYGMGLSVRNNLSKRLSTGTPQNDYTGDAIDALQKNKAALKVAYMPGLQGTDEDIYIYGDMETDPKASWKFSEDRLITGEVIASGRFAEVRKATLSDKNGQQTVAAKVLKVGASSDDKLLMKAKMNFLATSVPIHENIVMLVGAVPTDQPVILLEYCSQTLKDWLKKLAKVSPEDLDNMFNFTSHIANGLAHLHENHIVHRRLGTRNILLKKAQGRMIAKITGFGPMNSEVQTASDSREKIPFKWMAPEQIGGKEGKRRPYNSQTDVWTFSITLWEIFSKGGIPYKEYKHGEIKEQHDSGYRLPRPEHATDELYDEIMMPCWNQKPMKRPSMSDVSAKLRKLFHGAAGDEYYYEDDAQAKAKAQPRGTGNDFSSDLYATDKNLLTNNADVGDFYDDCI